MKTNKKVIRGEDLTITGTHNSMSYLPVKNKLFYLANILFAKCQNKDFGAQYFAGARCFDLRIYYNNGKWEFAHGLVKYETDFCIYRVIEILSRYSTKESPIYIRLILEKYSKKGKELETFYFKQLCGYLESTYKNIKFIGGNRKKDWKKIYTFKSDIPDNKINQFVSSMAEDVRWYEKFIPWAYAKRMNKTNFQNIEDKINLFDFL